MQQNNGLKFSHDRKNYIDFQLDVWGEGEWGYFENVQWMLCVKESICVRPLRGEGGGSDLNHQMPLKILKSRVNGPYPGLRSLGFCALVISGYHLSFYFCACRIPNKLPLGRIRFSGSLSLVKCELYNMQLFTSVLQNKIGKFACPCMSNFSAVQAAYNFSCSYNHEIFLRKQMEIVIFVIENSVIYIQ